MLKLGLGGIFVASAFACANLPNTTTSIAQDEKTTLRQDQLFANPSGYAATFSTTGSVELTGAFFTSFGTNGRTCGSCHQPSDGWTVIPSHVQERFEASDGLDPIFRLNDGSVSPNADVSTVGARRAAYSMLLSKGLIRVGIGVPANADFDLADVDDPYGYASAAQLSLFRRPLPSANLEALSTVMWDGRETFVDTTRTSGTDCLRPPFPAKCFQTIDFDLSDQSNGATRGHAQAAVDLTAEQRAEIVNFETSLYFAQYRDRYAGRLDRHGATGGPENIASQTTYFGQNDNFGDYGTGAAFTSAIFNLYDRWADDEDEDEEGLGSHAARAQVARGQALFNNKPIVISGVGGLNGSLGLPASFTGTCGTCHDQQNFGNHSVPAPLNIGLTDASRRTADMPLYTLRCSAHGITAGHCKGGQTVQTTDPGRALITGVWADIGKFKGPILRGLAARAPYFHNGSAADLGAAVDFYNDRFGIGFTADERADLVAFLRTL